MKTKKSLNPQIVAPVERTTTTTSRENSGSPALESSMSLMIYPFGVDDGE